MSKCERVGGSHPELAKAKIRVKANPSLEARDSTTRADLAIKIQFGHKYFYVKHSLLQNDKCILWTQQAQRHNLQQRWTLREPLIVPFECIEACNHQSVSIT
jgi:hypothetical protein